MSSYHVTTGRPGVAAPREECAPVVCPECGGLECLCRPRFFAGQLLTDEDLNRLDHYIVEKGKLRNRYLHGWGVACGLEVVCHPCNAVTVGAGYALSPCGEDIVVCSPVQVDVCDLINRCREEQRRGWECEPSRPGTDEEGCKDVYEEWVLAVRYEEKPSRGVMALRGGSSASRCGCGGSSSCGCGGSKSSSCGCGGGAKSSSSSSCGCGGSSSAGKGQARATAASRKGAQAQCEPTVICEGYAFEVYKVPKRRRDTPNPGALAERISECVKRITRALPAEPKTQDKAAWHEWCCNLKEALLDLLAEHPVYECLLAERLARVICPEPQDQQTPQQYIDLIKSQVRPHIAAIGAEYLRYCICSALLPPCPGPVNDPRVPLATITVRRDNCRIVRVCNIGVRKFLTTFPNLQYWLSFIPLVRQLRGVLERLCCTPFQLKAEPPRDPQTPPPPGGTVPPPPPPPPPIPVAERGPSEEPEARAAAGGGSGGSGGGDDDDNANAANSAFFNNSFGTNAASLPQNELLQVFARAWGNRAQTVDARTLFLGALGATDEKGEPVVTQAELDNPLLFIGLNQVARPALARVPESTPAVLANIVRLGRGSGQDIKRSAAAADEAARSAEELSEVKAQLAQLEAVVRRQQETIAELAERLR